MKNRTTAWPGRPPPGCTPGGGAITVSKRRLHPTVTVALVTTVETRKRAECPRRMHGESGCGMRDRLCAQPHVLPPGPTTAPEGVTLSGVRQRQVPYDLTRLWTRTKPDVQKRNTGGCQRCRGGGQRARTPSDTMNAPGNVMYSTGPAASKTALYICTGLRVAVESSYPPCVTL